MPGFPLYFSDRPTPHDILDFVDFRPALAEVLLFGESPLTIGIFGPWGSGKTSLLRMLQADVEYWGQKLGLPVRTVWFTAWKYERREALWRAFLLRVLDALYPREDTDDTCPWYRRPRKALENMSDEERRLVAHLERLEASLYRTVEWEEAGKWVMDWWQMVRAGSQALAEVVLALAPLPPGVQKWLRLWQDRGLPEHVEDLLAAVRREVHTYRIEHLQSVEQFEALFHEALRLAFPNSETPGRLIVFVDDLDRCLPEKALEILEAIKLFLEVEGTAFVLALDREVLRQGIEAYYAHYAHTKSPPIQGDAYLQKFIQIPFTLPPLEGHQMDRLVRVLTGKQGPEEAPDVSLPIDPEARAVEAPLREIFILGLRPNPRQIKRALNTFRLLQAVALVRERRGRLAPNTAWPLLAKMVVLQLEFPEVYEAWLLPGHEMLLPVLERILAGEEKRGVELPSFLQRRIQDISEREEPVWVAKKAMDLLEKLQNEPQRFFHFSSFYLYQTPDVTQIPKAVRERYRYRFAELSPDELRSYRSLVAPLHMEAADLGAYVDVVQALKQEDPTALWETLWGYRNRPEEERAALSRWLPFLVAQKDYPEWVLEGAKRLLEEPPYPLTRWLLEKTTAEDARLRHAAFRMLRHKQLHPYIVALLANPDLRPAAQETLRRLLLAEIPAPSLVEALRQSTLRDAALDVLVNTGNTALPYLQEALHDPDPAVRKAALEGLRRLKAHEMASEILLLAEDKDPEVRAAALALLGTWKYEPAAEVFVRSLRDPDPHVHKAAQEALLALGPRVLPHLMAQLNSPLRRVREHVIEILAQMGGPEVRRALRDALMESQTPVPVREAAAWLLGRLAENADDLRALVLVLEDEVPEVRRAAEEAFQNLYRRSRRQALETLAVLTLGVSALERRRYLRAIEILASHIPERDKGLICRTLQRFLEETGSLETQHRARELLQNLGCTQASQDPSLPQAGTSSTQI